MNLCSVCSYSYSFTTWKSCENLSSVTYILPVFLICLDFKSFHCLFVSSRTHSIIYYGGNVISLFKAHVLPPPNLSLFFYQSVLSAYYHSSEYKWFSPFIYDIGKNRGLRDARMIYSRRSLQMSATFLELLHIWHLRISTVDRRFRAEDWSGRDPQSPLYVIIYSLVAWKLHPPSLCTFSRSRKCFQTSLSSIPFSICVLVIYLFHTVLVKPVHIRWGQWQRLITLLTQLLIYTSVLWWTAKLHQDSSSLTLARIP